MRKERKHYSPEEKVAILRRHLLDQVPVSDLCEGQGLQPKSIFSVATTQETLGNICDITASIGLQ